MLEYERTIVKSFNNLIKVHDFFLNHGYDSKFNVYDPEKDNSNSKEWLENTLKEEQSPDFGKKMSYVLNKLDEKIDIEDFMKKARNSPDAIVNATKLHSKFKEMKGSWYAASLK